MFAVLLVVFAIGVSLAPLLTGVVLRPLVAGFDPQVRTGLSEERSVVLADDVRRFVLGEEISLPAEVDGREGFDARTVAHLEDVHSVVSAARGATAVATVLIAALAIVVIGRGREREIARALQVAGGFLVVSVAGIAVAVTADFGRAFSVFHGFFFEGGTWVFPMDSLIIQLFPEDFWVTAGAMWAVGIAASAAVMLVAGRWWGSRVAAASRRGA